MKLQHLVTVVVVSVGLLLAAAGSAMAEGFYPGGDTIAPSAPTNQVAFHDPSAPFGSDIYCNLNMGAFQIPTNHSETATFTTRPSFSSCMGSNLPVTVTTSGTWTITVSRFSLAAPTINIPNGGINIGGTCSNGGVLGGDTWKVPGTSAWFNGFTSPVFVNTVAFLSYLQPTNSQSNLWGPNCWGTGSSASVTANSANILGELTFSDTTNPNAVPVVG